MSDQTKKPTPKKQRSKLTKILAAPILAIIFLIGWTLYCIGQTNNKQKPIKKQPKNQNQEEIELILIPKDEQTITT